MAADAGYFQKTPSFGSLTIQMRGLCVTIGITIRIFWPTARLLSAPPAAVVLPTSPPVSHTTLSSPTTWHQQASHSSESCSKIKMTPMRSGQWACSTDELLSLIACQRSVGRRGCDEMCSAASRKTSTQRPRICSVTTLLERQGYVLGSNPSGEQSGPRTPLVRWQQ
jgi:hypothetical protein